MQKKALIRFLDDCVGQGWFPGAVALVSERGEVRLRSACGDAVTSPERIRMREDTIFDVASLTKPVVTSLLVRILDRERQLSVENPVAEYLPQFRRPDKEKITVLDCLDHSAGFRPWMPLYLFASSLDEYLSRIADEPLAVATRSQSLYSCLDYIILGGVIRAVTGRGVGTSARVRLFEPLKLDDSYFPLPAALQRRSAATERGDRFEKKMAREFVEGPLRWPWEDEVIWGTVHDGNARRLGEEAGNSGLFTTADDLHTLARESFAPVGGILAGGRPARGKEGPGAGGTARFAAGWERNTGALTSAGPALPGGALGHTGFTGTSLWVDPVRERIYILLTNRVHPECREMNMNEIRRKFHALAAEI
jgi:CubicO group peptidase (beta-lactamase class C family)